MGCDIHVYLEYSNDGEYWKNLTDNAGSRNYVMFGVLAGVRVEDARLFTAKGMPDGELGFITECGYWLNVAPDAHPEWANDENYTSLPNAMRWIESGYSKADYRDGKLWRVTNPDWHTHSWLSADEVEKAIEHYRGIVGDYWPGRRDSIPTEWAAILGAMRAIERNGEMTRVVFWFDN